MRHSPTPCRSSPPPTFPLRSEVRQEQPGAGDEGEEALLDEASGDQGSRERQKELEGLRK